MLAPLPWTQFLTVMTLNWPQLYWKINFLPRSKIFLRIRYKMFHNSLLWNMCICQKLDFFLVAWSDFFFPWPFPAVLLHSQPEWPLGPGAKQDGFLEGYFLFFFSPHSLLLAFALHVVSASHMFKAWKKNLAWV